MNGVVAAGHPLTAEAGAGRAARGRQRGRCRGLRGARLVRRREPADRARRRRLHDGPPERCRSGADRLLRRRSRAGRSRAAGRAGAGAGPLRRRDGADVLRRPGLLRGAGDRRRAGARRCERFGSMPLGGAGRPRRFGWPARAPRSTPSRPTSSTSWRRSTSAWRARASSTRRGAGRCARATCSASRSWPRRSNASAPKGAEPFYRGEVAAALSDFVVEHGGTLGRGDLAAYAAIERTPDPRPLPRRRGADQPAAVLRRHPDRLLPRAAGAPRRAQRPGAAGRRDGRRQRPPWRGVRGGALRGGDGDELPRAGRPRPRGRRPARLDHPHLGARRRRDVRQRHLLQRLRLGGAGAGNRGDPQQHARRGGPQPARLPPRSRRGGGCRR